jgi:hypothetical protein
MAASAIEEMVHDTVASLIQQVSKHVASQLTAQITAEFTQQLGKSNGASRAPEASPAKATKKAARVGPITKWVADDRARRVPNFVIDATGLDKKQSIITKFGDGAVFEVGKDLPKKKA